jgi:hypothetical protein
MSDDEEWSQELERTLPGGPMLMALSLALEGEQRFQESTRGQNYLRRGDLLPNPREGTPWEAMYAAGNNKAFITSTNEDIVFKRVCVFACLEESKLLARGGGPPSLDLDLERGCRGTK